MSVRDVASRLGWAIAMTAFGCGTSDVDHLGTTTEAVTPMYWTLIGPKGVAGAPASWGNTVSGVVTDFSSYGLLSNPTRPATWFISTAGGGLFKYVNPSWVSISASLPYQSIMTVSVNPSNVNDIVIGTGSLYDDGSGPSIPGNGIYRTTDGGTTWTSVLAGSQTGEPVFRVARNPSSPSWLHAATANGYFRSVDNGATWPYHQTALGPWMDVLPDPSSTNVYAVVQGQGFLKSSDFGSTWTTVTDPTITGSRVGRGTVAIASSSPQYVFFLVSDLSLPGRGPYALFRSNNYAANNSFTAITAGNSCFGTDQGSRDQALGVSPTDPQRILAGMQGMCLSTNGGTTWATQSIHSDNYFAKWYSGQWAVVGNDGGLFFNSHMDTAGAWSPSQNTVPNMHGGNFDVSATASPRSIYGAAWDTGIFRSTNDGTNWYYGTGGDTTEAVVDPANQARVWVGDGKSGMGNDFWFRHRSTDSGATWTEIDNGFPAHRPNQPNVLITHDGYPPVYLYSNYGGGVYQSVDGGDSWSRFPNTTYPEFSGLVLAVTSGLFSNQLNASIVYAPVMSGADKLRVYNPSVSTAGWTERGSSFPAARRVGKVAVSQLAGRELLGYALLDGGPNIYRTVNGGTTWNQVAAIGLPSDIQLHDLVVHPVNQSVLFLATERGVYDSTDSGVSWSAYNEGLPAGVYVSALRVSKVTGVNTILYAGTWGASIWNRQIDGM
jgi:hypothetical protein